VSIEEEEKYWVFNCGQWLDKEVIALEPAADNIAVPVTVVKYIISISTGHRGEAGTDANVYISLHGKTGSTQQHKLESKSYSFERGKTATFELEVFNIGDLTKITIRHDNTGYKPNWFLDNVYVKDQTHKKEYTFQCKRWLSKVCFMELVRR
jgi:PLAT/LH2 domain